MFRWFVVVSSYHGPHGAVQPVSGIIESAVERLDSAAAHDRLLKDAEGALSQKLSAVKLGQKGFWCMPQRIVGDC